MPNVVV
jgi:hypothetical protein